jgi:hypothetical protein
LTVQPWCVQIAVNATTVPVLGCAKMIGLPSSVAEIEPPTGISLSLATCLPPPPGEADLAPPADVAPPDLVEFSAELTAVDGRTDVVADAVEPELHPVSTNVHKPAAPAPPAQSTVRRVR